MVRDSVQLETAVNTISYEYLLDFTSEYGIPETLHPKLPGPGDRIVDFPEGKVDERVFPTVVDWRTNASKDGMPANGTYSVEDVRALDTHRTPIQKQPEMLLCMVGISRKYYLGDEVYPTFHYDDDRGGNRPVQFDSCSKSYEGEDWEPPPGTAAPEMPSSEDVPTTTAPGANQVGEAVAAEPPAARESRKRGHDGTDANDPPNDPDPLDFADASSPHPADVAQSSQGIAAAGDPESENVPSPAEVGSPRSVYWPEWGVTNGSLLDTPEVCQDLVDHAAPPGYFSELRHIHNKDFLRQYNINLARQVAMGSQLRLRFKQEAKLLRKSVAQVARRDQRIQARESEIKNLEALLETEVGIKRAVEEKSVGLSQELERMRAQFLELQDQLVEQRCAEMDARLDALSIDFDEELYPHMLTAIAGRRWVIGHGLRLALMKCAESLEMRQAFADVVSAGVAKGMSEGLKHGVEHGHAKLTVDSLEAYDPEAEAKFAAAL
nr:hypothetical protein [Tanacetum cinerariifolium]